MPGYRGGASVRTLRGAEVDQDGNNKNASRKENGTRPDDIRFGFGLGIDTLDPDAGRVTATAATAAPASAPAALHSAVHAAEHCRLGWELHHTPRTA